MKKTAALSALLMILSGALARAEDATPAATQKYTQAELDASPYLKSVVTREGAMADTSKFKKNGPYKIALAAQGPTNCSTRRPATTSTSSARTRCPSCSMPAPMAAPTSRRRKSKTC